MFGIKPMVRMMAACIGFGGLAFLLLSCGADDAIQGATVVGPDDTTVTYVASPGFNDITSGPLGFQVLAPDGKTPVPNVHISFFAGGQVFMLTDRSGNPLSSSDPFSFNTNTDERGLSPKDVYAVWFVPPCRSDLTGTPTKAGPDEDYTGTVTASIGSASKVWTVNITVKGGTQNPPDNCP
ncbi:MAG TPA: hypothetical protein VMN77_09965 [Nitrospiria bacterium]|nr:hypothetical protein [Nitrospiria bacterium]